ncbi:MAG: hypothetical protein GQ536_03200 [Candidatus Aminicenantes bacterium]|nr:hypothetical protein [Candidatus Aminicenantes bacterium]
MNIKLLISVFPIITIILFLPSWEYSSTSSTSPGSVVKAYVNRLLKGDLEAYFTYNFYIRLFLASGRNREPKERWQEMEQKLKESYKESLQRSIGTIKGVTLPFPWIIFYEYGKVLDEMKGLKKEEIEEKLKEEKWKEIIQKLKGCFLAYDFLYEPKAGLKATIEEVKPGPLINLNLDGIFQLGVYKDTPTWEAFIRVEYLQQDTAPWLKGGVKFDPKFDGHNVKEALIKINVIKIMPKNEHERMRVEKLGLGGFIVDGFTEIVEGALVTWGKTKKREIPQEMPSPGVVKGEEFISKTLFIEKEQLGIISDITRGELDRNPGPEIGIAGSRGALMMDSNNKEISIILFSEKARHVDAIDVNGDGECEFMNRGGGWQAVSLFDHQGNKLWSYNPPPAPNGMVAGDLDGDGTLEFVVGFNGGGGVHLLDKDGKKQWIEPDANVWHVELVDTNQDGRLEIVHSNAAGQIRVRDSQGKILSQAKPSSYFSKFSLCRWPTLQDREYALMWAEDKTIRLFDFDGKMMKQFKAPESVWVMGAWGMPVRLKPDEPEYFAVLVELRAVWHRSILYVYDAMGSLVFQEIIPETCKSIATFSSDKPGGEIILVGGEGKVWEYKATDTTKSQ